MPGCNDCDPYEKCGAPLPPQPGKVKPNKWDEQVNCYAMCDGASSSKALGHCPDATKLQFPEPLPGISGFGKYSWPWSIMDTVHVPTYIPAGEYLLSWRWDCEESTQVWQNVRRQPRSNALQSRWDSWRTAGSAKRPSPAPGRSVRAVCRHQDCGQPRRCRGLSRGRTTRRARGLGFGGPRARPPRTCPATGGS